MGLTHLDSEASNYLIDNENKSKKITNSFFAYNLFFIKNVKLNEIFLLFEIKSLYFEKLFSYIFISDVFFVHFENVIQLHLLFIIIQHLVM